MKFDGFHVTVLFKMSGAKIVFVETLTCVDSVSPLSLN